MLKSENKKKSEKYYYFNLFLKKKRNPLLDSNAKHLLINKMRLQWKSRLANWSQEISGLDCTTRHRASGECSESRSNEHTERVSSMKTIMDSNIQSTLLSRTWFGCICFRKCFKKKLNFFNFIYFKLFFYVL